MSDFWVGAAAKEITPPARWINQGRVSLWGYGSRTSPATGVRDPLWARALSLHDSRGTRFVVVSLDIGALAPEMTQVIRGRVEKKLGIPSAHVSIHVTHTHSAPVTVAIPTWNPGVDRADPDYLALLQDQALAAIEQAIDSERHASLTWARGTSRIGLNRHFEGGAYDASREVFKATDDRGKPIAIAFFHGCHATTLREYDSISADFPGVACDLIERAAGGLAFFFQGFAGTIKPVGADPGQIGKALAEGVLALLPQPMEKLEGTLAMRSAVIELPLQPLDSDALVRVRLGDDVNMKAWANYIAALADAAPATIPAPLQVLRVGNSPKDWIMAACAHEVAVEFTSAIRAGAVHPRLSLLGYANSVMCYLPTPMILAFPPCEFPSWANYDGSMSFAWYGHRAPLAAQAGSLFVSSMLDLLRPWQPGPGSGENQ